MQVHPANHLQLFLWGVILYSYGAEVVCQLLKGIIYAVGIKSEIPHKMELSHSSPLSGTATLPGRR